MKCRFVVDVDVNPQTSPQMQQFVKLRQIRQGMRTISVPYWPAGTEYEVHNAAFFVLQGMAEPVDEECYEAAGRPSKDHLTFLQHAYKRQALGIVSMDWDKFDAGYIAGYDAKGEYIPGPKWDEYQAILAAEDEEDDE